MEPRGSGKAIAIAKAKGVRQGGNLKEGDGKTLALHTEIT